MQTMEREKCYNEDCVSTGWVPPPPVSWRVALPFANLDSLREGKNLHAAIADDAARGPRSVRLLPNVEDVAAFSGGQ